MSDIFISYAREDLERAKRLAEALKAQGWSVFWDRYIPPGKTWREVIAKALHEARCVIVAWSRASIGSGWVHEEAEEGHERKILVPVSFEETDPDSATEVTSTPGELDRKGQKRTKADPMGGS